MNQISRLCYAHRDICNLFSRQLSTPLVLTHSLPLSMLARYLKLEIDCVVVFLGIQPGSNEVGERVSPDVLQAVHDIVETLSEVLWAFSFPKTIEF